MKHIAMTEIAKLLLDTERQAKIGAEVLQAVLQARSARWTELARAMKGSEAGAYKRLQRFMAEVDLMEIIGRLHDAAAPFVIGDPTEIVRRQAKNTAYVGYLKDGETRGFWMLLLATPYRGRALPCGFVTYSSATINAEATSRNQYHFQAFAQVKELLGERPLVLDREFSYLELLQAMVAEQVNFVIRLNQSGAHPPRFTTIDGQTVKLHILPGKTEIYHQVFYKGSVPVNVIGTWRQGFSKPLWVMTSLPALEGLAIYLQRMKIELSFRDLKSLLGMHKLMNQQERWMRQSLALFILAFAIGLVTGECLRDRLFGADLPMVASANPPASSYCKRKWSQYSGLFVLLKITYPVSPQDARAALSASRAFFSAILFPDVRTLVLT
jgi:hypothetical protein